MNRERSYNNKSLELLSGAATITETLNGLKFSISPFSFFQIHTAAAEILFDTVAELMPPSNNVTLLDICCGTGTIGLYLSKVRISKLKLILETFFNAISFIEM